METPYILIEIKGGNVQRIVSSQEAAFVIIDHDILEAGENPDKSLDVYDPDAIMPKADIMNEAIESLAPYREDSPPVPNVQPVPPVAKAMNKLMFGEQACRIFFDEDFETLVKAIDEENIEFSLYEFTGNLADLLQSFSGWGEYAFLTEDEYKILAEL